MTGCDTRQSVINTLKPWKLADSVLYGPVPSRRLGISLGINLLPANTKLCTYDCLYCQCGWSKRDLKPSHAHAYPSLEAIHTALKNKLKSLHDENVKLEALTLAGNGEPLLYPAFPEAVRTINALRDTYYPDAKVGVLSNGSQLHTPKIIEALHTLDLCCMKLDPGNDALLEKTHRPLTVLDRTAYMGQLKLLRNLVIQSCFFTGKADNSTDEAVACWQSRLQMIQPEKVQIYTIDRVTAAAGLEKVSPERLTAIAEDTTNKTGLCVEVY